jgi:hypothetical protein
MGIEPPYIGLYGVWSVGGIEVRGMGWSMEVQGISNPDCNTLLRQNPARLPPKNRVR